MQITTGLSAREFAVRYLFSPLGFDDFIWHEDPQGINMGGIGGFPKRPNPKGFILLWV